MKRQPARMLVFAIVPLVLAGCAPMHVFSHRVGNPDLSQLRSFYIIHNQEDTGTLDKVVEAELVKLGFQATTGAVDQIPSNVDAAVTYEFQWFWDMGTYLLMLRIHLRNPETSFPYAMGESLRSSLARKAPEEMAREILVSIFNPAAKNETKISG